MLDKIKKIHLLFIIMILIFFVYKLYSVLKLKNSEIQLLDVITNNLSDELKESFTSNKNKDSNRIFKECPELKECPKCEEWKGPPCPECKCECPVFKDNNLIFKDLVTPYKIDFPEYSNLDNKKKAIIDEIFSINNNPEPCRDKEFFPYNLIDKKIDMDFVFPSPS